MIRLLTIIMILSLTSCIGMPERKAKSKDALNKAVEEDVNSTTEAKYDEIKSKISEAYRLVKDDVDEPTRERVRASLKKAKDGISELQEDRSKTVVTVIRSNKPFKNDTKFWYANYGLLALLLVGVILKRR